MDSREATGERLLVTLLGWEKAFDKVSPAGLFVALQRLGVPDIYIKAVQAIYNKPMFKVRIRQGLSDAYPQQAGIRQGCPLSPFLFILLLTVIFSDAETAYFNEFPQLRYQFFNLVDLEYADDTILLACQAPHLQRLLYHIETESQHYNSVLTTPNAHSWS